MTTKTTATEKTTVKPKAAETETTRPLNPGGGYVDGKLIDNTEPAGPPKE